MASTCRDCQAHFILRSEQRETAALARPAGVPGRWGSLDGRSSTSSSLSPRDVEYCNTAATGSALVATLLVVETALGAPIVGIVIALRCHGTDQCSKKTLHSAKQKWDHSAAERIPQFDSRPSFLCTPSAFLLSSGRARIEQPSKIAPLSIERVLCRMSPVTCACDFKITSLP